MSKKVLTVDLITGNKRLEDIIDNEQAPKSEGITYSGKYIKDNLISKSHNSNIIGNKELKEDNLSDKYVINYNKEEDSLKYDKIDDLIEVIDCGTF